MAKFNEKVVCLFNKDYKQLKKEAERRGMCYDTREKTIAKIIWKDAYDAGVNEGIIEGKNQSALSCTIPNCPVNCRGMAKPETAEYELYDLCENTRYRLELTEDQVRLLHWLDNKGMLCENEFTEWGEMFVDEGEI